MFYLGTTDCASAVYYPYGVTKIVKGELYYGQYILIELPDSDKVDLLFNPDILTEWIFATSNQVTTETVNVGSDSFILATIAKPTEYFDDGKYYLKLISKEMPGRPSYDYDPSKDATIPVVEYGIRRG